MPVAGFMTLLWETALLLLCTHRVSLGACMCEKMKHFHLNVQEEWHFHHCCSLSVALWFPSLQLRFL